MENLDLKTIQHKLKKLSWTSEHHRVSTLLEIVDNLIDIIKEQKAETRKLYRTLTMHLTHNKSKFGPVE
jgi:hypothetical protein